MSRFRDEFAALPRNTESTHTPSTRDDVLGALATAAGVVGWYAVILLLGCWL